MRMAQMCTGLLALLCLAGPAAANRMTDAWGNYTAYTKSPTSPPAVPTGQDGVCVCTLLSYQSPACQAAAKQHCSGGKTDAAVNSAFCNSMSGLKGVSNDTAAAAAVATYLQQLCYPLDTLQDDADYCPCFQVRN